MVENMSMNSQQKEKRHWDIDKPKLDNARKLGGTCHIESEDMEIEELREKKAQRRWRSIVDSAMRCKLLRI